MLVDDVQALQALVAQVDDVVVVLAPSTVFATHDGRHSFVDECVAALPHALESGVQLAEYALAFRGARVDQRQQLAGGQLRQVCKYGEQF